MDISLSDTAAATLSSRPGQAPENERREPSWSLPPPFFVSCFLNKAIAIRLEAIASRLEAIAIRLEVIASRLEAIASRLVAIASRLEAISIRLEAIAIVGWRPSL